MSSFYMNKVILSGNLGRAPLLRYTRAGVPVCELRVATTDRYVDADGAPVEGTQWHAVVVVGERAQACALALYVGAPVTLEGRLHTRTYVDARDVVHERTEVVCDWVGLPKRRPRKRDGDKNGGARKLPDDVAAFLDGLSNKSSAA